MNDSRAGQALDLFARLRLVFVAAAMLAFAGAIGSAVDVGAAPKAPAGFSVKVKGQEAETVTQSTIQGLDQESHDYKEPGSPNPVTHSGATLEDVVNTAAFQGGFDVNDIQYLTIKSSTGTLFISADEIFDPGTAYKQGFPALVGVDSGKTRLYRPQQVGGKGVVSLSASTIASNAHSGEIIGVDVSADDDKPTVAQNVTFSADVTGATNPSIKWSYAGGGQVKSGGTGKKVTFNFPKATSYVVYADVKGEDDSGGQGSLGIKIKGNKQECPKSEKPCGNNGGNGGNNGGNGCGTGNPDDSCNGNNDNGNGDGTENCSGGVSPDGSTCGEEGTDDGTDDTGDDGTGSCYPYCSGYPPSYTPSYTPPATDFPTTPSTPDDTPAPPGQTQAPTDIPDTLPPGVEEVTGTLISDVSAISGDPSKDAAAQQESSPVESAATTVDLDPADSKTSQKTMSLSVAGIVLLFFAGIGKELRRPRLDAS